MALIDRGRVMADYLENIGRKDSYKAKFEALCKAVDEAPAVDAAPVVRCRECIHHTRTKSRLGFSWCDRFGNIMRDDDFCSIGERRKDGGADNADGR